MVRMIAILTGFGLVLALGFGFAGSPITVQVTFFGSGMPTPDASNFEDCGPTTYGSTPVNDDCYAYLKPGNNDPAECDYNLGFRAASAAVTRLRVKIALMRDGKVIGRDNIQINSLDRPADDPYVTKTFRGECDAKQLRILEARAYVAGQETDLIATGNIGAKGLMPLLPDFFIKIGPASEG